MKNTSSDNLDNIAEINHQLKILNKKSTIAQEPKRSWIYLLLSILSFFCFSNLLSTLIMQFLQQRTSSYSSAPSSYSTIYSLCFLISLGISIIIFYFAHTKLNYQFVQTNQTNKKFPLKQVIISILLVAICYVLMLFLSNQGANNVLNFAHQTPFEVIQMVFTATILPSFPLSQLISILIFNLVAIFAQAFMAYLCISFAQQFGNYIFKKSFIPYGGLLFGILYAITIFFQTNHAGAFTLFILVKSILAGVIYVIFKQYAHYSLIFIYILLLM